MDSIYLYVIVAVLAISIVVLLTLLHAGLFYELRIRTTIAPSCPKRVAYGVHSGPYKNAGTAFKRLSVLVPNLKHFGIYYDSPNKVAQDKLRYIVGCSLPDTPSRKLEEMLKSNGYSFWTFPECNNAVVTEFPVRSMVSYMIAPWRVYPALTKYFEKHCQNYTNAGPVLELCSEDHIRYIAPLEENKGFFVPEVAMEIETKKEQ